MYQGESTHKNFNCDFRVKITIYSAKRLVYLADEIFPKLLAQSIEFS